MRYGRPPRHIIDWPDYRVGGDPRRYDSLRRRRRLRRAWRQHRPWIGRVALGLVLIAIATLILSSRRNRNSSWI